MGATKAVFTVGRLYARDMRRGLQQSGLAFEEDKGWLDSQFVVTGERDKIEKFVRAWQAWRTLLETEHGSG